MDAQSSQAIGIGMRSSVRLVLILIVILSGCLLPWVIVPRVQAAIAVRRLHSPDAAVRRRGLDYVQDQRERTAVPELLHCLETEVDPSMVELAGAALMRSRDLRGIEALEARADREPESPLKSRLMIFTARLADRDFRILPWLEAGTHASEPWRRIGACLGLLHLGRVEGGRLLIETQATLPADPRDFALQEFKVIAQPMALTIGAGMTWPSDESDA